MISFSSSLCVDCLYKRHLSYFPADNNQVASDMFNEHTIKEEHLLDPKQCYFNLSALFLCLGEGGVGVWWGWGGGGGGEFYHLLREPVFLLIVT
jgi:hypothetical protein